ncbi:hypothetical protein ABLE91_10985 [Aquabacter sp. CN5-332]|uniref:hypothetical protein n=1 Tax=Aquabacter sp. CN5-332 TaxID=3156608 RepID=UPI0032B3F6AB
MSNDYGHGGHGGDSFEFEIDVVKEFEVSIDLSFDTETSYESNFDPEVNIDVCVDIEGNFAGFNVDVQAVGDDGATEVNLVALTTDDYSSITLTGYSAVA